jgi:PAS domain S-box-containing protein
MRTILENKGKKRTGTSKKSTAATTGEDLRHRAFDNAAQANIITTASNGKIVIANRAACKLLGYSPKELLTKSRSDIFDIKESGFKKMLKERMAEGQSIALVTAIKKSGKTLPCEITSAVFMDEDGIEKAITAIRDRSQSILKQKNIDTKNEKIVSDNIALVKSEQKEIDIQKERIVSDNIVLAKSKQKVIDIKKEKIVADNIALAKSEQKEIDIQKERIVSDNIVLAKSKQKVIDIKKEKVVTDNIALAKSKQKSIDTRKEKVVAENIILAQVKSDDRLVENDLWIKHIGKTSYDVMWDWDIATGEIYAGDSVKEVFGYTVQKNIVNFRDFIGCLLPDEKEAVQKKLMKTLASRDKSWNDSYKFKRQDGSVASTTSRASIVRDEEGKAIRLIGAIQDVSRLQDLEKKLEEQTTIHNGDNEKFLLAAKLSFDVIWDWNILTNELFLGEGFEALFGYSLKNNKGNITDWGSHLYPDDKEAVEQGLLDVIASSATHWEHAYRFFRADGSIARVFDRASIIRHTDGTACRMIGAMQDITRQKELEEKLDHEIAAKAENEKNFKFIFNSSSDILFDVDLVADRVIISDAYEKEFGYKITRDMTSAETWLRHIHPDDKETVIKDYRRVLRSDKTEWKYSYRFLRADSSVANILSNRIILRNADGRAYRILGSMHDVSKQKVLEEKLELEIKLKEKQISEAMEDAKEAERSDIGKELHDNINQLLGASRMYLEMAKKGGPNTEMYLSRSSEYTLTAIEEMRKLTKGLTTDTIKNLGLCEAITDVGRDTMQVNPVKISYMLESFIESSVNDKFKLNIFRIVQEQLNNILKHAKATGITISLSQNKKSVMLAISDNGVGFDTSKKRKGIGIDNIKSRAASYNGTANFVSQPGQGCVLNVTFPVADAPLNKGGESYNSPIV